MEKVMLNTVQIDQYYNAIWKVLKVSDMIGNTWKCLKNQMSWNIYQLYTSRSGSPTWEDLSVICLLKENQA